jgi:hypothetical protein
MWEGRNSGRVAPRKMVDEQITLRKISAPFYWIPKPLLDSIRPTWQGLLAYNALMYYAVDGRSRNIGIRQMADKVGVSQDTIKRGLKDLVAREVIQVRERMKMKKGKRMTLPNEYTLIDLAPRKQAI